nr:MAG TPA: hypothetical protein [Microviridae sp.]
MLLLIILLLLLLNNYFPLVMVFSFKIKKSLRAVSPFIF